MLEGICVETRLRSSPGEMVQIKLEHIWTQSVWQLDACAHVRLWLI